MILTSSICSTRQRCCLVERFSLLPAPHAGKLPPRRNSTIRRSGLGRPPAVWAPHVQATRRHCCPKARFLSQAVPTVALSRVLNSTIQLLLYGRPPAASPPHVPATRRHCFSTARFSSQVVPMAAL